MWSELLDSLSLVRGSSLQTLRLPMLLPGGEEEGLSGGGGAGRLWKAHCGGELVWGAAHHPVLGGEVGAWEGVLGRWCVC